MRGKLYGVGVGPGDPELLTLKAVRIINKCEAVLVPGENAFDSIAFKIADSAVENLKDKEITAISMPMTKDKESLKKAHMEGAKITASILDSGKNAAFLTLGDPTIYSTYMYLHEQLNAWGYDTEIVSGITSFCAAAALVNDSLSKGAEPLHIIPASYDIESALNLSGTKVLMKAGRQLLEVKKCLQAKDLNAVMIENCGMENERIYSGADNINENAGYYSIIIVKDEEK